MEPCAHRCQIVQQLILRIARAEGKGVREVRISVGLTPEYVELLA